MITIESSGNFNNLEKFFKTMTEKDIFKELDRYGREGVNALSSMTPVDSGLTAQSWRYEIKRTKGTYSIIWTNSHMAGGTPVAILIQYGHGTGTGGYVEGIDYINPAIKPIFDKIAQDVWKVVTSA